jgi:predicted nucleotidyltransferase
VAVDFEAVTELVKSYVNDVRRVLPVDKAVLFGSYTTRTATEQSDIDICFFLNSFDGKRRVDILKDLLGLMRGYKGIFFEPVVFPTAEIHNDNPFVKEILRTGVEIE